MYSYRYAEEVLQHRNYEVAWAELTDILQEAPIFIWPSKSAKVKRLDVVQQVLNTYFDRRLAVDHGWDYHPLATNIAGSQLKAAFRKTFADISIQVEVQLGYSAEAINVGVSIVPMYELAKRIDQNVVNFERAKRELPSAKLSITLPIAMIGVDADDQTRSSI